MIFPLKWDSLMSRPYVNGILNHLLWLLTVGAFLRHIDSSVPKRLRGTYKMVSILNCWHCFSYFSVVRLGKTSSCYPGLHTAHICLRMQSSFSSAWSPREACSKCLFNAYKALCESFLRCIISSSKSLN